VTQAPTAPALPVPVREAGYADDGIRGASFWNDLTLEETPELVWPACIGVYTRMRRQDAQVSSVLRAVTSPIVRTQWGVAGRGCREEVTQFVAENVGLPIHGQSEEDDNQWALRGMDRFSFSEHLRLALLMLPYGHSFFEQLYYYDGTQHTTAAGEVVDTARLRKLGPRLQRTIQAVNVARDGGLVSIVQRTPVGIVQTAGQLSASVNRWASTQQPIPITRLVAYVNEREGGNWLGTALLRPAYKNWLLKDRDLRTMSMSNDRNGMGVPVYTGAEKETDLTAGRKIASQVRAGDDSGAAVPNTAKLELTGVTGTLPNILESIRYHDEQIARAVLAHFLNLGTQTGSWALGSTFADFFTLSLQAVAEQIRDTFTRYVIGDLVQINYGPDEPVPQLVFDEIGARRGALDMLRELLGLTDDQKLAEWIRTHVTGACGLAGPLPTGGA
jgi:hypothetical protein